MKEIITVETLWNMMLESGMNKGEAWAEAIKLEDMVKKLVKEQREKNYKRADALLEKMRNEKLSLEEQKKLSNDLCSFAWDELIKKSAGSESTTSPRGFKRIWNKLRRLKND